MWQLNTDQFEALSALQRQRDQRQIASLLGQAFPVLAARLGDRIHALVALGIERGQAHGLNHVLSLARYLACWFALGAEFETRPGQEGARLLLQDGQRSEGAKAFQLCRRVREHLASQPAAAPGVSGALDAPALDLALDTLDKALADRGLFGSLQRGPRLVLGQACDIDRIALRLESGERQLYEVEQGSWTRNRLTAGAATLRVQARTADADDTLAAMPPSLWLLAPSQGPRPARLRLHCAAECCCDPLVHPLIRLTGNAVSREWRGAQTAEAVLETHAVAAEMPTGGVSPLLAPATVSRLSQLAFSACGLRAHGPSLGEVRTELQVLPAEQHLMVWRRDRPGAVAWTEAEAPTPQPARTWVRLERDGQALDASAWQAGWATLDQQLMEGLSSLFGAWRRGNGLERCTLEASPSLLTGEAGLSWGWSDGDKPLREPPVYRLRARLTGLACQWGMHLAGDIDLLGAKARLRLACTAAMPLDVDLSLRDPAGPVMPIDNPLQLKFAMPYLLSVEALATPGASLLHAGPARGAIVGSCGLRPRADGAGLQWFMAAVSEPVRATLHVESASLGRRTSVCELLPAQPLVDWSLG